MKSAQRENLFVAWLSWQFYEMPKFLFRVWNNYMMFASNFFSFKLLLKTFFAPWRKYKWNYPKGFNLTEFFNTLISNTFSRILGATMRIVLVVVGAVFQIFVALAGLLVFMIWFSIPFIVLLGIVFIFAF